MRQTYTVLQSRHVDVYATLKLRPFTVVQDFADRIARLGYLEPGEVPSWEAEQRTRASAPGIHRAGREPPIEVDVGMEAYDFPLFPTGNTEVGQTAEAMTRVESQGSDLGEKRNLSARSPDKAEEPSKRTRLANKTPATSKASSQHVYLTGKVYVNGSPVTPAVVPKVQGQVGPRPFTVPVHSNAEIDMQAMPKQRANPGRLCCDMAEGEAPSPVLLF